MRNTFYLIFLVSFGYFATDIYLPSLPAIAEYFGASESTSQMTLLGFILSFSVAPLFFGPLADAWGRKKIILLGLIMSMIATLGCVVSPSIDWLIGMRVFQGIGAGAVVIGGRAMIPDLYKGKEMAKQLTYMTMCIPVIMVSAPVIGGFIQKYYGWREVFVFLIAYSIVILIYSLTRMETIKEKRHRSVREMIHIYWHLLKHKEFVRYGLIFSLPSIGMFAYVTASPFLLQSTLGLGPEEFGLLSIFFGATIITFSSLNARLLKAMEIRSIIRIGTFLVIVSGVLMIFAQSTGLLNTWTVIAPSLVYFTCISLICGNAASLANSQLSEHFGSANALLACTQFVFGAIGCFIFSIIPDVSLFPLGICYMLVGLSLVYFLKPRRVLPISS